MSESSHFGVSNGISLPQTHDIFRSRARLVYQTTLFAGAFLLAIVGAIAVWRNAASDASVPVGAWLLLGFAALLIFRFVRSILPLWHSLGTPVLRLSKEGIDVHGEAFLRWAEVIENSWHNAAVGFVPVGRAIILRTQSRKVDVNAFTLDVSSDEYLRLCDLYRRMGEA